MVGGDKGADRLIASLCLGARQRCRALVAGIPIDFPLAPSTWAASLAEIEALLDCRLDAAQRRQFGTPQRHHRVVLFRAPQCCYAYLLPGGGPPTVVERGKVKRAYLTRNLLPLPVKRVDAAWAYGRGRRREEASASTSSSVEGRWLEKRFSQSPARAPACQRRRGRQIYRHCEGKCAGNADQFYE